MHRFVWDLHYPPLEAPGARSYGMAALYRDTPAGPFGPWVHPGKYTVKLTVNGQEFTQPLAVKMDPRVMTPAADLELQYQISMKCYDGVMRARAALAEMRSVRSQLQAVSGDTFKDSVEALDRKAAALEGRAGPRGRRGPVADEDPVPTLNRVSGELGTVLHLVQESEMTPTAQAVAAGERAEKALAELLAKWEEIKGKDLKELNEKLRAANQPVIAVGR
jgi:hypothetical protein